MNKPLEFKCPDLQIRFAQALTRFRGRYLQAALFATLETLDIPELDRQLARLVAAEDLSLLARYGLRGELLFAAPLVLEANPFLLGYYRLLMGYSQKEFYGRDKGFGAGKFKSMEFAGKLTAPARASLDDLCLAFCGAASALLHGIAALRPNKDLLDDLTLLTLGPQFRGGVNNQKGMAGIVRLFEVIRKIVAHAATEIRENSMTLKSAAGRRVLIAFAADPDIIIREEMAPGSFRNVVAIEVKSGTDAANIHNRIGEAEKSHQKARKAGYTECWTVVNVERLDRDKARAESPSTDRFYSLTALTEAAGPEFADFHQRMLSLTGIAEE